MFGRLRLQRRRLMAMALPSRLRRSVAAAVAAAVGRLVVAVAAAGVAALSPVTIRRPPSLRRRLWTRVRMREGPPSHRGVPPQPHLRRDGACPSHICTGTRPLGFHTGTGPRCAIMAAYGRTSALDEFCLCLRVRSARDVCAKLGCLLCDGLVVNADLDDYMSKDPRASLDLEMQES